MSCAVEFARKICDCKMICPKCHSENRNNAKFCDECGHKFGASELADDQCGHKFGASDLVDDQRGHKFVMSDSTAALPPLFNDNSAKGSAKFDAKRYENKRSGGAKPGDSDRAPRNTKLDLTGFNIFDERPPHSGDTMRMKRTNVREQMPPDAPPSSDEEALQSASENSDNIPLTDEGESQHSLSARSKTFTASADEADIRSGSVSVNEADARSVGVPADPNSTSATSDSKIFTTPASEEANQPTPVDSSSPKTVSAPADKADARARAREEKKRIRDMKKRERKARKDLQAKSKKKIVIPSAVLGVIVVVVIVGIAGYYAELWGGKTVPITAGMSEADAVYTLQQAGFDTRVSKVKSDDTEGIVLMTDPKVGTRVPAGSEIVVHVAESRTIPEVVGLDEAAALVALRENGYTNISDTQYTKTNEANEGQVIGVEPEANSKAKSSRAITLTVAQNYRVPDVYGMTEANATYTLREAGYYVYLNSVESEALQEGTVYSSDPQANTVLDKDKYVTIYIVQHRSSKLESLARDYLSSASTVQIGGVTYKVDGVQSVEYQSNGVVNFTISGSPTTSFLGESITLGSRSVSGAITFNDSNEVVGLG